MSSRQIIRILFVVNLVGLLALIAIAQPIRAQTPEAKYTLESADELSIPIGGIGGKAAYLSPDGQLILFKNSSEICMYRVSGEKLNCTSYKGAFDSASIHWSPDSKAATLTENFLNNFLEPDVWVIDAATGKLTDLTDDNVLGGVIKAGKITDSDLDVAPNWTGDSKQIFFIRYFGSGPITSRVYGLFAVDLASGEPKAIGKMDMPSGLSILSMSVSPDNKHIVVGVNNPKASNPNNGVWVSDIDGKNVKQIATAIFPFALQFSADSKQLLIFDNSPMMNADSATAETTDQVVALDGSGTSPVDSDKLAMWSTWSPSGSALAYIVKNNTNPDQSGVFISATPGAPGQLIYQGMVAPSGDLRRTLSWAANNTILVSDLSKGKMLLLHIGTPK